MISPLEAGLWRWAAAAAHRRLPLLLPAIAALAYVVPFCLHALVINWDQAHWIQAGERFARGQGLTCCPTPGDPLPELDPAHPVYRPITWWPPGYALLVGIQRQAGVSLQASCKVINVVPWLAGWFAWGVFLRRVVPPGSPAVLVLLGLPLSAFFRFTGCGTDVFLWAAVPVWLLAVVAGVRAGSVRKAVGCAALAGLLAGLAYWARYASLVLVPAGALCLVLLPAGSFRRRVLPLLAFLAVSGLPVGALTLWKHAADPSTSLDPYRNVDRAYDPTRFCTLAPVVNFLPASVSLEYFLRSRHVRQTLPAAQGRVLPAVLVLVCLGLALRHAWVLRKGPRPADGDYLRFLGAGLLTYLALVGMLAYLSYGYHEMRGTDEWTFLECYRYYQPLYLAGLALVLAALLAREPGGTPGGIRLLKACALAAVLAAVLCEAAEGTVHARRYWAQALAGDPAALQYDLPDTPPVARAIAEVRAQDPATERAVILAPYYAFFLVASDVPAYGPGRHLVGPTEPVHVFVVLTEEDRRVSPEEHEWAADFVARHQLTQVRVGGLGSARLYHKRIAAGELEAAADR
jgi:hypothetical protein